MADNPALAEVVSLCLRRWQDGRGDACRLFHGRGRTVPGFEQICIDGFPPWVLVTLFREPAPELERALLANLAEQLAPAGMSALLVQHRHADPIRLDCVHGVLPEMPLAREDGLAFRLDLSRGQNLGFFLDMREARAWLREHSAGRSVLNLFAFTCAFSVAARRVGAGRVVNIDMSRSSLATGRDNHRLNNLSVDDVHFLDHDIFRSWNKLHRLGRYDIIVMDPPTLQKGSFIAERDYAKVVRRFSKLLKPESDVLACLNAPHLGEDFLDAIFAAELPGSQKIGRLENPAEFADVDPQAGLKVIHYRYRRPADLPEIPENTD